MLDTQQLDNLIRRIRSQAEQLGGWMAITLLDEAFRPCIVRGSSRLLVAKNPFVLWSLGEDFDYARFGKERPLWPILSTPSIRQTIDSPLHTDWVLSIPLLQGEEYMQIGNVKSTREAAIARSITMASLRIVDEWASGSIVVLSRGCRDTVSGRVVRAYPNQSVEQGSIAIASCAAPEYEAAVRSAGMPGTDGKPGALISAFGGRGAHLAKVGNECGCTVVVVEDALNRFKEGDLVSLDLLNRRFSMG